MNCLEKLFYSLLFHSHHVEGDDYRKLITSLIQLISGIIHPYLDRLVTSNVFPTTVKSDRLLNDSSSDEEDTSKSSNNEASLSPSSLENHSSDNNSINIYFNRLYR